MSGEGRLRQGRRPGRTRSSGSVHLDENFFNFRCFLPWRENVAFGGSSVTAFLIDSPKNAVLSHNEKG